jgi:hypothetical protein
MVQKKRSILQWLRDILAAAFGSLPDELPACPANHLVRIGSGSYTKWFEPNPDVDQLTKHLFRLDQRVQSTYEAASHADEVEAAAAFGLLSGSSKLQHCFVLRIEQSDLDAVGIQRDDEGKYRPTGVVAVDQRHVDLLASKRQLTELVRHILARLHDGEDRVRRISSQQMKHRLEEFSTANDDAVTQDAKARCRELIAS